MARPRAATVWRAVNNGRIVSKDATSVRYGMVRARAQGITNAVLERSDDHGCTWYPVKKWAT